MSLKNVADPEAGIKMTATFCLKLKQRDIL